MGGAPKPFAELAGEEWRAALAGAPRELFVPDVAWTTRDGLVDRRADPDTWHAAVARDDAIVTQIDDGATELTAEAARRNVHKISSSCSAPTLVFDFLRLLDPYPGDRVLEIGTGTGWTAALLSAKLGAGHVTSIEVDEQVAKQAAANLERAGFFPTLVVGDGADGCPEAAPFDRVHVTCGAVTVPFAWVEQTRPGGVIVAPWMPGSGAGRMLRLVVTGEAAVGRFHGSAAYMTLRAQRQRFLPITGEARESGSRIDPRRIGEAGIGFLVAVAGLMPGVITGSGVANPVDGTYRLVARDEVSDSHAIAVQPFDGGAVEVRQRGPRDLWEELEAAFLTWVRHGEPGADRFGLEVDANGQHVWLDHPRNRIGGR